MFSTNGAMMHKCPTWDDLTVARRAREALPQLLSDERHEGMQQTQASLQACVKHGAANLRTPQQVRPEVETSTLGQSFVSVSSLIFNATLQVKRFGHLLQSL
jgi:hypothetical protein